MNEHGSFPARIVYPTTREHAPLDGDFEPFYWTAEISSGRLDAYHTHMRENTLRNFAQDASSGVAFLDSHDHHKLGSGQSLSGSFETVAGVSRVTSDFYTVPGIRFGGSMSYESTDDFIKAVKSGLARDVSVGFYGGDMVCDICGNSFYDFRSCTHWPGFEYANDDETIIATFGIDDARLAEVSAVYDGATPQAMILRAQDHARTGEIEPRVITTLERKFRIKLPDRERLYPGWTAVEIVDKGEIMTDEITIPDDVQAIADADTLDGVFEAVRRLDADVKRLAPLADQGHQYRAYLIDAALVEGVRAMGDHFPTETYQAMFESAPLEHVKQLRDTWAQQAKAILKGGPQVKKEAPAPHENSRVPDAAYKS